MASETVGLQIKVDSDGVTTAGKRLDSLAASGDKAGRATDGLMKSFKSLIGPVLGGITVVGTFSKIIGEQQKYQKLTAQLEAVTGSVAAAVDAYEDFDEIEGRTAISVDQLTAAFTTLENAGLDSSKQALEAYANIAAGTGTEITAVADAIQKGAYGMSRGLQQLGIKVKEDGRNLKVTFRGVTETIKNDSQSLEKYMQKLGEGTFKDAAEMQANVFLKIQDAWDDLWLHIGQSGATEIITNSLEGVLNVLQELDSMVRSGQLNGYLAALGEQFRGWKDDVVSGVEAVSNAWNDLMSALGQDAKDVIAEIKDGFKNMGANIRASIQIVVVSTAAFFDEIIAQARSYVEGIQAIFTDDTFENVGKRLQASLKDIRAGVEGSYQSIYDERQASINSMNAEISKADTLRKVYDHIALAKSLESKKRGKSKNIRGDSDAEKKEREEFKKLTEAILTEEQKVSKEYEDRAKLITKYTKEGSAEREKMVESNQRTYDKEMAALTKTRLAELTSLEDELRTEEEKIQTSYERRKKIIEENSVDQAQYDLMSERLQKDRDKSLLDLQASRDREREQLAEGLLTEEQITIASYERRRKEILRSKLLTESESNDLLTKLATAHANELRTIQIAPYLAVTESASKMFEGLGETIKNFGGEQSEAYHALFAVSKAFSVAQGTLSVATGMANALSLTWPQNLVAMMAVAAQGASLMSQITSTNFSGAYDAGGRIPAGKFGLVGERGPELVSGPANVVGREATAGMLGGAGQSIRIVNAYDSSHVADFLASAAGEKVILNVVKKNSTEIKRF